MITVVCTATTRTPTLDSALLPLINVPSLATRATSCVMEARALVPLLSLLLGTLPSRVVLPIVVTSVSLVVSNVTMVIRSMETVVPPFVRLRKAGTVDQSQVLQAMLVMLVVKVSSGVACSYSLSDGRGFG
jgi:hypothetical protein